MCIRDSVIHCIFLSAVFILEYRSIFTDLCSCLLYTSKAPDNFYNGSEEKPVTLTYAGQNKEVVFAEDVYKRQVFRNRIHSCGLAATSFATSSVSCSIAYNLFAMRYSFS